MPEIATVPQLLERQKRLAPKVALRLNGEVQEIKERMILVCGGTGCHASNSERLVANFQSLIAEYGLEDRVQASISGCFGFCEQGPIVKIFPDDVFYVQVKPSDAVDPLG